MPLRAADRLTDALRALVATRLGERAAGRRLGRRRAAAASRVNVRVVDAAGDELAIGRDLAALRAQLGEAAQLSFAAAGAGARAARACGTGISAICPKR